MKDKKVSLLALPLMLSVASAAHGQDIQKPYTFKIGGSWLTDKDARDATDKSGWTAGFGYRLQSRGVMDNMYGWSTVDLDYSRVGNDDRIETTSLWFVDRAPFDKTGMSGQSGSGYYGFGVGIAMNHARYSVTTNGGGGSSVVADFAGRGAVQTTTTRHSKNQTRFAAQALVGFRFSNDYFAELSYRWTGKVAGFDTNTFNLTIGLRF